MAESNNLTADLARQMFDYDPESGTLTWETHPRMSPGWNNHMRGKTAGKIDKEGYRVVRVRLNGKRKHYRAHRLIWLYVHGEFPRGEIDHINGVRDDNRLDNLRVVSDAEQSRNAKRPSNNTSGESGISWDSNKGKWRVTVYKSDGTRDRYRLRFRDFEDARIARWFWLEALGYHKNHGRTAAERAQFPLMS